jgi:hypothetical protein
MDWSRFFFLLSIAWFVALSGSILFVAIKYWI